MQYFTRFQLTARSRGPSATAGLLVIESEEEVVCILSDGDIADDLECSLVNPNHPTVASQHRVHACRCPKMTFIMGHFRYP